MNNVCFDKGFIQRMKSSLIMGYSLSQANFKLKIEGTYLGLLWYLLEPFVMFFTLNIIFAPRIGNNIPYYQLYLLIGVLMFHFFSKTTSEAITSIFRQGAYLRSLQINPIAFVFSALFVAIYTHIGDFLFLIVCFIVWKGPLIYLVFYPVILVFFIMFILGVSLILASIGTYAQDFVYFWRGVCMVLWFIIPIFYVPHVKEVWVYLNPIYCYISVARDLILYHKFTDFNSLGMMIVFSFLSLFVGIYIYEKYKDKFAEII